MPPMRPNDPEGEPGQPVPAVRAWREGMKTEIEISKLLFDDGVVVGYYYQPFEPRSDFYPGCDESVEIDNIHFRGIDIYRVLTEAERERLEEAVLAEIRGRRQADMDELEIKRQGKAWALLREMRG